MLEEKTRGIVCDLDGTLYQNSALQRDFSDAFVAFVSMRLDVGVGEAEQTIQEARLSLERRNGFPASEMWVLRSLGLASQAWLDYSKEVVRPEKYLSRDPQMRATIEKARTHVWFDITTNTVYSLANRILACLGLDCQYDGLWTPTPEIADNMGKPSLELYSRIAAKRNLSHSNILVIGDRWHIDLVGLELLDMKGQLVKGPEEARSAILAYALGTASD
jgi:FMN phosphatase YigB (HAD superfamily)